MMFDFPASPSEGQAYSPPGGPGYVYTGGRWKGAGSVVSIEMANGDDIRRFGTWSPDPADALINMATLQTAYDEIVFAGGGSISFPPYGATITAAEATRVGVDEGACLMMTHTNGAPIIFRGTPGASIIRAASNKLELFAKDTTAAFNLAFSGISFTGTTILQDQVKPSGKVMNSGIAGRGNGANCAISQYHGGGLFRVETCAFREFNAPIDYIGDNTDPMLLVGDVEVVDTAFHSHCFGLLVNHPRSILFSNILDDRNTMSRNSDGSHDPGHAIYVTDRGSGYPENIVIDNVMSNDGTGYGVRCRKGVTVSVNNIVGVRMARGFDCENCKYLTVSNIAVQCIDDPDHINETGIDIVCCGFVEADNLIVDMRGMDAWGITIDGTGETDPSWQNRGGRYSNITVLHDYSSVLGKAPIMVYGQRDTIVDNPRFMHYGTTVGTRAFVDVRASDRVHVLRPKIFTPDGAADARLTSFDATCTDCYLEWAANDVEPASPIITDSGVNTTILKIGNPTGPLLLNPGSAAAPAYAFAVEPGTGFRRAGTGSVGYSSNGTDVFRFYGDSIRPTANLGASLGATAQLFNRIFGQVLVLQDVAAAPSAVAGLVSLYINASHQLVFRTDDGVVHVVTST